MLTFELQYFKLCKQFKYQHEMYLDMSTKINLAKLGVKIC